MGMGETLSPQVVRRQHQGMFRQVPAEAWEQWERGEITLSRAIAQHEKERPVEDVLAEFRAYCAIIDAIRETREVLPFSVRQDEVSVGS